MNIEVIKIPQFEDYTGNIGVVENDVVPFDIKRIFYLYNVPENQVRGRHAHKELKQFLIALSGSFDVVLDDGKEIKKVKLDNPDKGLLIHENIWNELKNFSSGAVCMVIASDMYSEEDYIRDYDNFLAYINPNK